MRIVRWSLALLVFIASVLVPTVASAAPPVPGPGAGTPQAERYSASVVRFKLTEDSGVRLRGSRLALTQRSGDPAQLAALDATLSSHGAQRLQRLFTQDEAAADASRATIQSRSGRQLEDLTTWIRVTLDGERAEDLAAELQDLPAVEAAYPEVLPPPPPASGDYRSLQYDRARAPVGVDEPAGATVAGSNGDRVKVVDLEYSWNTQHEDLSELRRPGAVIANGTPRDHFDDPEHGTAVMGVLGADPDARGVSGLVPGAELYMVNTDTVERGWNLANAIDIARVNMGPGDVMLIEQQTGGAGGGYVPAEYQRDVYDAIVTATAAGVIVVEAAGNGAQDLDSSVYAAEFGPGGRPDSGAIIVGAGGPGNVTGSPCLAGPARGRLDFSTYGQRVDVQGWGACVVTTGVGDWYSADGPNSYYTIGFSGTSSAAAIVAGTAASLSSAMETKNGVPPRPETVRDILTRTGTAQSHLERGEVGPLPDLRAAYAAAGLVSTASAPGAPTGVSATASSAAATVRWSPPASDGGAPISSYQVTARPGGLTVTVPGTDQIAQVRGLANGTPYSFTVTAINSAGAGPASAPSGTVTPRADVTPPAVTLRVPEAGATAVAQDAWLYARFSEPVLGVSGSSVTLRDAAGAPVAADVRYDQAGQVVGVDPNVALAADTRYTLTLTGGASAIRDVSGNPLATVRWTFTTGPAPTVTAQTPAVDASAVARSSTVTATFSEPVLGVTGSSATLRNAAGATVAATVRYDATTRVVTVDPAADLAADTRYTVTLTGGPAMIRDAGGNPLTTVSWSFSTGTAPTVTARTPADGSSGVAVTTTVTATFSEAVTGVTASSFQLVDGAGVVVPAVVTYNSATRTATLDPRASLPAGGVFRASLNGGSATVRDAGGNPVPTSVWSFRT